MFPSMRQVIIPQRAKNAAKTAIQKRHRNNVVFHAA
jgi:hypothetical protein